MSVRLNMYLSLVGLIAIPSCSEKQKVNQPLVTDSVTVRADTAHNLSARAFPNDSLSVSKSVAVSDADKWLYKQTDSTGVAVRSASIVSADVLRFTPPFDGGSTITMRLRERAGNTTLSLVVSKGQFTSSFQGGSIRIRFDDGASALYQFSAASDGATDIIFLDSVPVLLKKLKTARRTAINVGFYGQGTRQVEFRTAGLRWDL